MDGAMNLADDDDSADRLHMLRREILSYLTEHPDAKDTVEGIMDWWLSAAGEGVRADEVGSALESLVVKGWVTVSSLGRGTRVYGLDRARRREILEWLES
jgi:hypothetical protein